MKIVGITGYTIPMFGNKNALPYGKLIVMEENDRGKKSVPIRTEEGGKQFIVYKRKRYYVSNIGSLYSPSFAVVV